MEKSPYKAKVTLHGLVTWISLLYNDVKGSCLVMIFTMWHTETV